MRHVELKINGTAVRREVEERTLLVHLLRDTLHLTGTHVGCDTTQCGACMVHLNGKAAKSCTVLAVQAEGSDVTTIEGVASGDQLHPVQAAFRECHGLQCGYCTPGMIMMSIDMIRRHGAGLTKEIICEELEGNICRCTGYVNIIRSIQLAAKMMHGAQAVDHSVLEGSANA